MKKLLQHAVLATVFFAGKIKSRGKVPATLPEGSPPSSWNTDWTLESARIRRARNSRGSGYIRCDWYTFLFRWQEP